MQVAESSLEDVLMYEETDRQFFLFKTGNTYFALATACVQEMVGHHPVTAIPMMHRYVKGVTNIRGDIVTVIDLKDRLGLGMTVPANRTTLVLTGDIALMVDEVYAVEYISDEAIVDAPEFGLHLPARFVKAIIMFDDHATPLLDCKALLDLDEIAQLKEDHEIG